MICGFFCCIFVNVASVLNWCSSLCISRLRSSCWCYWFSAICPRCVSAMCIISGNSTVGLLWNRCCIHSVLRIMVSALFWVSVSSLFLLSARMLVVFVGSWHFLCISRWVAYCFGLLLSVFRIMLHFPVTPLSHYSK